MDNKILKQVGAAIGQEWGSALADTISEEQLLQLLADKIAGVIARGAEPFFQLMYRLDIPEKKLNDVLGNSDAAAKIARLVYERQLQKIQSRQHNKMDKNVDDPELEW